MLTANDGVEHPRTLKSISWLLARVWFGGATIGFDEAATFHPLFGPMLMVGFAAMSNTLLLTSKLTDHLCVSANRALVLISLLSNTVARIDAVSHVCFISSFFTYLFDIECHTRGSRRSPFLPYTISHIYLQYLFQFVISTMNG